MLEAAGVDIVTNESGRKLTAEETVALCGECVGILAGTERYDEATLRSLPALRVLSRIGAGVDNIDREAAAALDVEVRNTPDGPTDAVVELTIALIFDMLRHVSAMDRAMREGLWSKRMGNLLAGKRVGIVGLGRIGSRVGDRLNSLGCIVAYCDIRPHDDVPFRRMCLEELLPWADIVTLHCTAAEEGCDPMIGAHEIALMREGAWLVNASRGELVDEAALTRGLESRHLSGAAVDVFSEEPYQGPLLALDKVVLTPHVGSYAAECRSCMEAEAVRNLLDVLQA